MLCWKNWPAHLGMLCHANTQLLNYTPTLSGALDSTIFLCWWTQMHFRLSSHSGMKWLTHNCGVALVDNSPSGHINSFFSTAEQGSFLLLDIFNHIQRLSSVTLVTINYLNSYFSDYWRFVPFSYSTDHLVAFCQGFCLLFCFVLFFCVSLAVPELAL